MTRIESISPASRGVIDKLGFPTPKGQGEESERTKKLHEMLEILNKGHSGVVVEISGSRHITGLMSIVTELRVMAGEGSPLQIIFDRGENDDEWKMFVRRAPQPSHES